MDALDKEQAKALKAQHREYRAFFKIVRSKIRKCKAKKETKTQLIDDLRSCNNIEIMHYLMSEATFNTIKAYLLEVNNWLTLESATYEYPLPPYIGNNFGDICELIRLRHNYLDLKKAIFENE